MRSLKTAYFLQAFTLIGFAGLHRLYMGKVGTGILWFCTWGLFGVGSVYDAVTMARQLRDKDEEDTGMLLDERDYWARLSDDVRDSHLRERIRRRHDLDEGYYADFRSRLADQSGRYRQPAAGYTGGSRPETLEHAALRLAQANGGYITPAQLALEANVAADEAKNLLDSLCSKGMADIRIRKNGVVAYVFLDFLRPEVEREFESL
jgi:TM2 domain-containing membrane protein YozV